VMNQMEQSLLPNEKSLRLVDAIYGRAIDLNRLRGRFGEPLLTIRQ
jgi:hypothetical protein